MIKVFLTGGSGFIGTHFVERLLVLHPDAEILNWDKTAPNLRSHDRFWVQGDLMERGQLIDAVKSFQPDWVLHMAARTDPDGRGLEDYSVNMQGSDNVIEAIKMAGSVKRSIFVSTQYVVRPGPVAVSDTDYRPYNLYGESKCVMEQQIRKDEAIPGIWTIVRPTNVWGAWHPRYAQEFWLVVKKRRYVHPGGQPVTRAYAFVGNVVEYMVRILESEPDKVAGKTFYVGDPIDDIKSWVSAFSIALVGRPPIVVPRPVLRSIALVGDAVRLVGASFPLFTARYRSMTQDYVVNMEPTFIALGAPAYSLRQGVDLTVEWLKTQGEIWRR